MALKLSTGLRTKILGTNSLKALLDGGCLKIYTGAQPATPETTESGSLLVTISATTSGTGALTWGTSASGSIPKNASQWSGTCGTAGVAGWFRCYDQYVMTGADAAGTGVRFDGDIGTVTGDLKLSSTTLAVNVPVIIDTATFAIAQNQS
jgi:hypothetical protein